MIMSPELSIIIPCYNEAKNIPLLFERCKLLIRKQKKIEIILVNNGSQDYSRQVFNEYFVHHPQIKIIHLSVNKGYGYGILCGLKKARGEVLCWTHADMQTDLLDVIRGYQLYLTQKDSEKGEEEVIVKGLCKNRPWQDSFFMLLMSASVWLFLKIKIFDINAQPKIFSRHFYEKFLRTGAPQDFSLDLFLLYQARKHKITILNVPVHFNHRLYGEAQGLGGSLKNKLRLIRRAVRYIYRMVKNPPKDL